MEQHQDEHITCAECGTTFVFTAAEAASFASKGLEPPKRCFECRRARRAQRGGQRQEGPPRQLGGDVNGYRSPMSDPAWSRGGRDSEYRAPGFRDSRGANERSAGRGPQGGPGEYRAPGFRDSRGPRDGEYRAPAFQNARGPRSGEYRAPTYGNDRGPQRSNEYRAPAYGNDRGPQRNNEYRAPAFQNERGAPQGGARGRDEGAPRRDEGHGARPPQDRGPRSGPSDRGPRSGPSDRGPRSGPSDRGPRSGPSDRGPRSDRGPDGARGPHGGQERAPGGQDHGPRRQAERPSYPITCAQCGAASAVPFKPQEGREILCRDCYRARKESAA
jgi:CxxC-x17-CxxC domain-containing protein